LRASSCTREGERPAKGATSRADVDEDAVRDTGEEALVDDPVELALAAASHVAEL
jgi:hypothetical protein